MSYDECHRLSAYLGSNKHAPSFDDVIAVHVLTHESMHMAGDPVEATAECAAVQRDVQTAELLGASQFDAQGLARRYWTNAYPRLTDNYRSVDCAPGGSLDEHLASAAW